MAIITGTLDPPGNGCSTWQQLTPEHPRYPMFHWVLTWQEEWSAGEHVTYWQTHLPMWPRAAQPSRTALVARHAAVWLQAGYSQAQIAEALGYKPGNAPKTIWRQAAVYLDWLRQTAPPVRPDGPGAVAALEEMFARRAEIATGQSAPGEHPSALSDPPIVDVKQARRYVRRRWRTPRVVTLDEWEREPFGWPEPISTRLLYGDLELRAIERAEQRLREQAPYQAAA